MYWDSLTEEQEEGMMGQVAAGRSLIRLLELKTEPEWQRRDLRAWFDGDPRANGDIGRAWQAERFSRTMDQLLSRLKPKDEEAA